MQPLWRTARILRKLKESCRVCVCVCVCVCVFGVCVFCVCVCVVCAPVLIAQSCPTHCSSTDSSPPGSVHGIVQALSSRTLHSAGVGSHSLLQGIFLTQGLNPSLLHSRQILYCLSHQGSPMTQQSCSWALILRKP